MEVICELLENMPDEYVTGEAIFQSRVNLSNVLIEEIGDHDDLEVEYY